MPLVLNGATSGSTTIQATDAVTATLTLPSSTGTLVSTANPISGSVIQTVSSTYATFGSNSTTTMADSGLTVSITPKFSTSKILVIASINIEGRADSGSVYVHSQLVRNSTTIFLAEKTVVIDAGASTNSRIIGGGMMALSYLDSPSTTSSTTYKVQYALNTTTNNSVAYFNNSSTTDNGRSTITVMEIAA